MPERPLRPCRKCRTILTRNADGYCNECRAYVAEKDTRYRETHREKTENDPHRFASWQKLRALFLQKHPLCAQCERNGREVFAAVVDHITRIEDGGELLDENNLQSLCVTCHNRKTAQERTRTIERAISVK